jgi:hypothetical protein
MKIPPAFLFLLFWIIAGPGTRAAEIHVDTVNGEVLYGAPGNPATIPVKPHTDIQVGRMQTSLDGSLYASPGPGSKFHLDHDTAVDFTSNGLAAKTGGGQERDVVLAISQGRMTAAGVAGSGHYEIQPPGGRISMGPGLCVLCMHGDAAHVYVAKGSAIIFPHAGTYQKTGLTLLGRPTIGILHSNGTLETQPLNQVAPGIHNCLLSGATPEVAAHVQEGSPNPANLEGNPDVSETE